MSKNKYRSKQRNNQRRRSNILSTPLLLVIAGIILATGALFALWKAGQPSTPKVPVEVSGRPSVKVDRERVDLGDVPLNQAVSVTFQLANVGDQTLRFTSKPVVEVAQGC